MHVVSRSGLPSTVMCRSVWNPVPRAIAEVLALRDGKIRGANGGEVDVDRQINTMASVVYDGVIVPGGADSIRALSADGYAVHFVAEAYKHAKPVAAGDEGLAMLQHAGVNGVRHAGEGGDGGGQDVVADRGVVTANTGGGRLPDGFLEEFAAALGGHRVWNRDTDSVPA